MEYSKAGSKEERIKTTDAPASGLGDPSEGYVPRSRPRREYSDQRDNSERISANLNRINKRYVATPYKSEKDEEAVAAQPRTASGEKRRAVRVPTTRSENAAITRRRVASSVRTEIRTVTRTDAARRPFPLAIIACCLAVTAIFMYVISLYIKIDDYDASINTLNGEISSLNDEITALELRLDNKYDLDEIERIATEQYRMVRADQLPKKYISIANEDVVEIDQSKPSTGFGNILSVFSSLFGFGD